MKIGSCLLLFWMQINIGLVKINNIRPEQIKIFRGAWFLLTTWINYLHFPIQSHHIVSACQALVAVGPPALLPLFSFPVLILFPIVFIYFVNSFNFSRKKCSVSNNLVIFMKNVNKLHQLLYIECVNKNFAFTDL